MNFFPEMSLGSKFHCTADFPNPSYNVKLFSSLGGMAIMWDCVDRGSVVSLRPQTLPCPSSSAWFDFETVFENLNLVLDIRDDQFHR